MNSYLTAISLLRDLGFKILFWCSQSEQISAAKIRERSRFSSVQEENNSFGVLWLNEESSGISHVGFHPGYMWRMQPEVWHNLCNKWEIWLTLTKGKRPALMLISLKRKKKEKKLFLLTFSTVNFPNRNGWESVVNFSCRQFFWSVPLWHHWMPCWSWWH